MKSSNLSIPELPEDFCRLGVKLFLKGPDLPTAQQLLPIWHKWIQQQAIADHLLIDVHDYSHVHQGPGLLLVAHEGNLSLEYGDDRPGLVYYRKRPFSLPTKNPLEPVWRVAVEAAERLATDSQLKDIRFDPVEFLVFSNDRLRAPNSSETYNLLHRLLADLFKGQSPEVVHPHQAGPRVRFSALVRLNGQPSLNRPGSLSPPPPNSHSGEQQGGLKQWE